MAKEFFLGVDTGGTFTDFVLWHAGQIRIHKVLSTPQAPEQAILQAEGYAVNRVKRAEGDAARFISVYDEYRLAPQVTQQRMYLEAMATMMVRVPGKVILDKDAQGVLPLFSIDRIAERSPLVSPTAGGGR